MKTLLFRARHAISKYAPLAALALLSTLPAIARADLASELSAPGDTPQLRGLGVGGHFGRMPNWDIDKLIPYMKKMGVQYVRDEWGWGGVEQTRGVFAMPADGQHKFDALNAAGIKIICALDYGNKLYTNPLDPDAFANYAAWMAGTYKGKVAAWEIWNEPDNFYFFKQYGGHRDGSDDAIWNAKYSELVRKAAAAIKNVDSQAVVIHNNEGTSWHNALIYHASDYAQCDGVDIHPYPTNPPKDGVEGRTPELDLNSNTWPTQYLGHRVQCWVGECGMSTYTPKDPAHVHFTPVTEPLQAACEVRTVLQGLVYGVKAWCIYDFVDESANPNDVESNFGLIRDYTHNYEPKPAFYSLQRVAKLLGPDWQSVSDNKATLRIRSTDQTAAGTPAAGEPIKITEDAYSVASANGGNAKWNGPLMYWFRVGNNQVTILWKAGKPDMDGPPALGKIVWPGAPKGATAEAIDLVTGKNVDVKLSSDDTGATLSGVPVNWSPVAIRWTVPAAP